MYRTFKPEKKTLSEISSRGALFRYGGCEMVLIASEMSNEQQQGLSIGFGDDKYNPYIIYQLIEGHDILIFGATAGAPLSLLSGAMHLTCWTPLLHKRKALLTLNVKR